jgi:hypothetical protein
LHYDDHDDFGGLRRDLTATGAALDRRGILKLGARRQRLSVFMPPSG